MRKAMERQYRLDCQPVVSVQLNPNCRDEMIPFLTALQHLYAQPELRDDILRAIAADVNGHSSCPTLTSTACGGNNSAFGETASACGGPAGGTKELIAVHDGFRESEQSWKEVLLDLRSRGLQQGPELAIGDGAFGFWKVLPQVFSQTRLQRCWVH